MLRLLLTTRLRMLINAVRKGDRKKASRKRFALFGYLLLPVFFSISIFSLFNALQQTATAGLAAVHTLLNSALLGLLILLLFSGVTVSLHFFFLAKDYPLLRCTPIPSSTLFGFKYIEAVAANSSIFMLLGLPLWISYGLTINAPLWYYPVGLIAALLFLTLPTGVAAVLSIGLVRLFPAKRAKNIAALFVGLIFIVLWTGFQFLRVSRLNPDSKNFDAHAVESLAKWDRPVSFLPSDWLARIWQSAGQGRVAEAALPFLALLVVALLVYLLGQSLMESQQQRAAATPAKNSHSMRSAVNRPAKSFTWALISREIKLLRRDSRHTTQLLMFAAIILVLPFITQQDQQELSGHMRTLIPFLTPLLLCSMFCCTTAARMIPLEGFSFSLLKCSPRPLHRIVLTKNLLSASFGFLCGLAAIVLTSRLHRIAPATAIKLVPGLLATNLTAAGIGGFFGAWFGKFDWQHPKRMLTGSGNLLLTVLNLMVLAVLLGLIYLGISLNLFFYSLAIALLIGLIILTVGTILAAQKLDSMDWRF